jgi:hypothetical protein
LADSPMGRSILTVDQAISILVQTVLASHRSDPAPSTHWNTLRAMAGFPASATYSTVPLTLEMFYAAYKKVLGRTIDEDIENHWVPMEKYLETYPKDAER